MTDDKVAHLLRCSECRKGVQLYTETPIPCPYCKGRKWTNRCERLTIKERCQIYKRTGILPIDHDMGAIQTLTIMAAASLTGRK